MDRAVNLRQGIWDGVSLFLLVVLFGWTAATHFDRVFLFCVVAGIYLILRFSSRVLADSTSAFWISRILIAASAVILVSISDHAAAFLFLPFSLPAMRSEEKGSMISMLFRGLLLPGVFAVSALSGIIRVEMADAILLAMVFSAFSFILLMVERRLLFAEECHRRERQLLEKSVAEAVSERDRRQTLLQQNALVAIRARQEERETLSRNIHNEVGHSITASLVALEAADILIDQDTELARQKIRTACERMRESLTGIRRAVRVMDEGGFLAAAEVTQQIEAESKRFSADTNIIVRTHAEMTDASARVPAEHAEFLLSAVRELISNGVRHGKATSFVLVLIQDAAGLRLTVEDNGCGMARENSLPSDIAAGTSVTPTIPAGFGLSKILSYVERFGGNLMIAPGSGFRISLNLPVTWGEEGK